ncbi:MAG: hypothetical protein LBL34_06055 [Clostridiales bacterium]|jgi:hypothetical protein|nr:hypothetical protein [Clostridiales bacterium]
MSAKKTESDAVLTYKDKPLLRKGNLIYYGNHDDKYIICMQIEETKKAKDLDVSTHIVINLQTNAAPGKERIIKKAERDGLYSALDIGEFWLTDALEGN